MGATVIPQTLTPRHLAEVWVAVGSQALGGALGRALGGALGGALSKAPTGPRVDPALPGGYIFPRVPEGFERASASQVNVGDTALG